MSRPDRIFQALDPTPPELKALTGQLADRAEREGVLDVAYRMLESPVGDLLIAATKRGLVKVAFQSSN